MATKNTMQFNNSSGIANIFGVPETKSPAKVIDTDKKTTIVKKQKYIQEVKATDEFKQKVIEQQKKEEISSKVQEKAYLLEMEKQAAQKEAEERQKEKNKLSKYKEDLINQKKQDSVKKAEQTKEAKLPVGALIPNDSAKFAEKMKKLQKEKSPEKIVKASNVPEPIGEKSGIVTATMEAEQQIEAEKLKHKKEKLNKYIEKIEERDKNLKPPHPALNPKNYLSEEEKKNATAKAIQQNKEFLAEKKKKEEQDKKDNAEYMKKLAEESKKKEDSLKQSKAKAMQDMQKQMKKEIETKVTKKKEIEIMAHEENSKFKDVTSKEALNIQEESKSKKLQEVTQMKKYHQDLTKQIESAPKEEPKKPDEGLKLESYVKSNK